MMQSTKIVAIYARVSTSNQENEGTIETQLSAVNQYISENGFIVANKYVDEGWSGDSIVRPALDQLRIDAKKKIWEAVVIYDPDRLARRYSYQELITDELREGGIEVLFITTPTPKNGVEKILHGVQGLFAEYERAKIAERFRLGKVRKAKEGHIITSEAPYGYDFILKQGKRGDPGFKQGYYVINKHESLVVKDIFSWVANERLSLRRVVLRLQELGIKPRKSKREVWNTSTLSTLIRNKTYIGQGHFGASYAVIPQNPNKIEVYKKNKKSSRRFKPESEWIIIPTPRILEDEIFYRAGKRLRTNFELSARNTKNEYLLAGRIWCTCGLRRAGEGPQKGKHLYYRCTDRVKSFPLPHKCCEKGINARIADHLVWNILVKTMSSPELLKKQIERWYSNNIKVSILSKEGVNELKKDISTLKKQVERYVKAYGIGAIDMEGLKDFTNPIKERIKQLNQQILIEFQEINKSSDKAKPSSCDIDIFAEKAIQTLKDLNFSSKKAIVETIIDKVVGTRNELQVYGYIPINNINEFTNYRYPLGTIRPLKSNDDSQKIPFEIKINMPPPQNLFGNPAPVKNAV